MSKLAFLSILCLFFAITLSAQSTTFSTEIADSIFQSGRMIAREGNYKKAFSEFEKALHIYIEIQGEQHLDVANTYAIMGHIEKRRDRLENAINFYDKALLSFPSDAADSPVRQASLSGIYNGLSGVYRKRKNHKKGLEYLEKALDLRKKASGEQHYRVGYLLTNMGNYYDEIKDYDSALTYYSQAKIILEDFYQNDAEELANIYNNFGDALRKNGQLIEAKRYFYLAKARIKNQNTQSLHLALSNQYLGETYTQLNQKDSAIYFFKKAVNTLGMNELNINSFSTINSPNDCLQSLAAWSNSYLQFYKRAGKKEDLYQAKASYELASQYLDYLKADFRESRDKIALLEQSYSVYEGAIRTAYAMHQLTDSVTYLYDAFRYSEQGRNALLRQAVQNTQAKEFAGIPDSLLLQETTLATRINDLKKAKFEEEIKTDADQNKIYALTNRLFDLRKTHADLLDILEQDYPKYFALKYATQTTSITDIQTKLLRSEQALLEYFVGDSVVFAFVISAENFQVFKIEKDFPLEKMVEDLRTSVYTWRPTSDNAIELEKEYVRNAYALYQHIIQPIETVLPENLIIIPSGILGYLPFEALVTNEPLAVGDLSSLDFLLGKYEISYSYSATLLAEMLRESNTGREVLAFAPEFGIYPPDSLQEELPDLKALRNNQSEVNAIRDLIGGLARTGENATLQNFRDLAPLYKILHLATHGKANDEDSEFSYLAFSYLPDSVQNELLYVRDLYNMNLRADMVVLSACETGIGNLQRGEGVVSLARGFSYAGAKSIVTTLWQVDDRTSEEIMVSFYRNLSKGMRKDKALRTAKLSFLDRYAQRAHPIFWAGYVPIGNMEAINLTRETTYWQWLLASVFVVFLAFFSFKKMYPKH